MSPALYSTHTRERRWRCGCAAFTLLCLALLGEGLRALDPMP